jgi:hypothetical protein
MDVINILLRTVVIMKIEERDAKAVYFSLEDYDDAKLLRAAANFLANTPGWLLLGLNRQSDEFGSHLTLFLERIPIPAKPVKPINEATPEEIEKAKQDWERRIKEEAAKRLGGSPDDYVLR